MRVEKRLQVPGMCSSEAEIRHGVSKLPVGRRQRDLATRMDRFFADVLAANVVPFDGACAKAYADIRVSCEARGHIIENEDTMIAATARVHGAVLVTRNLRHLIPCGISLVDPWHPPP